MCLDGVFHKSFSVVFYCKKSVFIKSWLISGPLVILFKGSQKQFSVTNNDKLFKVIAASKRNLFHHTTTHCFDLVLLGAGNFWTKMLKSEISITGSPKSKFWTPQPYGDKFTYLPCFLSPKIEISPWKLAKLASK